MIFNLRRANPSGSFFLVVMNLFQIRYKTNMASGTVNKGNRYIEEIK